LATGEPTGYRKPGCSISRSDKRWGRLPYVVTPKTFEVLADGRSEMNFPVPVSISLAPGNFDDGRGYVAPGSFMDPAEEWKLIVLYPFNEIDESMEIYPHAVHPGITGVTRPQTSRPGTVQRAAGLTYRNGALSWRPGVVQDGRVQVFRQNGALVYQASVGSPDDCRVQCSGLTDGIYLTVLRDNQGHAVARQQVGPFGK
jgi:hypothetical protein